MKRIVLRSTDIASSSIGFGCAGLTSLGSRADAVRLLNTAFDGGVTHYDTARLYGLGHSESIVGEFLKGKRESITLTTKFGLSPSPSAMKFCLALAFARGLIRRFPFAGSLLSRYRTTMNTVAAGAFSPTEAAVSLETSLRQINTDRIDILLLHEATLEDALMPGLVEFLEGQIARGTVRYVGIGSSFAKLGENAAFFPKLYRVLQFEDSVVMPNLGKLRNADGRGFITHTAISKASSIAMHAKARPDIAARHRGAVDYTDTASLCAMMLLFALRSNPEGIILFGTTRLKHLQENLRALRRDPSDAELDAFAEGVAALAAVDVV